MVFEEKLGLKLVEVKEGSSKLELKVKEGHLNQGGIVHGGVISSICDCTLACAVNNTLSKEQWCVTVELSVQFLYASFPEDTLYGIGKVTKKGKNLVYVEGHIENQDGKVVTKATGIWFVKDRPTKK